MGGGAGDISLYLPHISPIGVDPVGGGAGDISLISPPYLPYRSGPCGWRSWRRAPAYASQGSNPSLAD